MMWNRDCGCKYYNINPKIYVHRRDALKYHLLNSEDNGSQSLLTTLTQARSKNFIQKLGLG